MILYVIKRPANATWDATLDILPIIVQKACIRVKCKYHKERYYMDFLIHFIQVYEFLTYIFRFMEIIVADR